MACRGGRILAIAMALAAQGAEGRAGFLGKRSIQDGVASFLQTSAQFHDPPIPRPPVNLTEQQPAALLGDTSEVVEVCGTRPMMPQLQFALEVYRELGLVQSPYTRCHIPSWSSMNIAQLESITMYMQIQDMLGANAQFVRPEDRAYASQVIIGSWSVVASYVVLCFIWRIYSMPGERKQKPLEKQHRSHVTSFSVSWLDSVIGRYGRGGATVTRNDLGAAGPDLELEPFEAFRGVWKTEVKARGLERASLADALWTFVGTRTIVWMLLLAGVSVVLEFVGMALVLDVLVNYLRWAGETHARFPGVNFDTLRPTVMIIGLCFAVPLLARGLQVALSLCDCYYANRIVSALLTSCYEKCQVMPPGRGNSDAAGELTHMLNNDIIKVWSGALRAYVYTVMSPVCILFLDGILIWRFGWAGVLGFATSAWILLLYIPIREISKVWNFKWLRDSDTRTRFLKESVFNIRAIKMSAQERNTASRMWGLRDRELSSKFRFAMAQSSLQIPFGVFPCALVVATLLIHSRLTGEVSVQDVFTCMQVLSGLVSCTAALAVSLQKVMNLPNSIHRVERFLRTPEGSTGAGSGAVQRLVRHPDAPHVRIQGSFSFGSSSETVLHDVNFSATRGELVAVVGGTSSGKSAFLSAMLGELAGMDEKAHVEAPEKVSYCPQQPWMINGTLEENVTLGGPVDDKRYDAAVRASMLHLEAGRRTMDVVHQDEGSSMDGGNVRSAPYFPYFTLWNILATTILFLSALNVRWETTSPVLGLIVVLVQGLLHWSVLEIPLQTIATLCTPKQKPAARADASHLTIVLNYNLLAISEPDVDECLANMYEAYMGNLQKNVSAVLVSATNEPALQEYELRIRDRHRERIFRELRREGLCWAGVETGEVDDGRRERVWSLYSHLDSDTFVKTCLDNLCRSFAEEYMVLHRVSRVLRKCGQYQDLMLLSSGEENAYTYCDAMLYGSAARTPGEPLFMASKDMRNVCGRHFDYTLVLDSDTRIEQNAVFTLLEIASAHPDRAIIQPAIRMSCGPGDSIFMHIEAMRQNINDPMTNTITSILGESGFYGKGLIQNQAYMEKCLGTREKLIECVPIDVLSHDTFEAAVLRPMYTNDIHLLEAPCRNYVTWDIRERRWNRGELLLAMYFFPTLVGGPMRWLQSLLQGRQFNRTQVRTVVPLGPVSSYLAHSALRQLVLKPLLVSYIIMVDFVEMHYEWLPIMLVMFAIIVFPKLAICNRNNIKGVLLETMASILQFTPESVVGTIRVLRALKAHITGNARWIPQRAVEEEFEGSNPFTFSIRYLWYYMVFATGCGVLVVMLIPEAIFIMTMLGTLFALPLYAGFTALATKEDVAPTSNSYNFPYFAMWRLMALTVLGLSAMNVKWTTTHTALGILVVAIQGLLHWSVLEIPLQTIAALVAPANRKLSRTDASNVTVVLNYNLLAISSADVDECMTNMLHAYMGNLHANVSAALVSATNDPALQEYELQVRDDCRERIFNELYHEGLKFAGKAEGAVDQGRRNRIWSKFEKMNADEFVDTVLDKLCLRFAREFMVLHRVSRVLRKCGQYQDLMLLSSGEELAYTYCDTRLYGASARKLNERLFRPSEDAVNVKGRGFEYTLVLDGDTRVEANTIFDMLEIAAAYPDSAILQPAIKMDVGPGDSIYMHLEAMRQSLNEPMNNTITSILGQSGFYGKGLIKNSIYIDKCLGTRDKLVEALPIDVLSHDTFEAAVLRPLYCGEVYLLEAPCGNYVTWDIRERRWNRGEILLATYFFPKLVGVPVRWLQSVCQGKQFNETKVRTVTELNDVTSYLAHAALRQIILKPLLVTYIILVDFVEMHFEWLPILCVMFAVIVFPKFASCNLSNFKAVLLETMASILQFTPESVVGTIRVLRALKAHLTGNARWVPQRAVEEEFRQSDPFTFSLRYLWYYLVFALLCGMLVVTFIPEAIFIMTMLGTLFTLPLYAGFTALATESDTEERHASFPYFTLWNVCAALCFLASVCNVQWEQTNGVLGVMVVLIQGLLHWSVLEIPLQTIATFFTYPKTLVRKPRGSLTMALNYNLLAISKADVDECMQNMYEAFVGNLDPHISAVLVSATNDPVLRDYELHVRDMYRERLYNELVEEGKSWAGFGSVPVNVARHENIWSKYSHLDRKEFVMSHLNDICRKVVQEFIVLHRVSRVLRKCGQYQDLMLLSSGEERAFTYCDSSLYGTAAREPNELLFITSADTSNVFNRKFDYTLVLDSDTRVEETTAFELLRVASAYPDRAIVQPAIRMDCGAGDSIFMHVEAMRQSVNEPMNNTITAILGESGFYGKGLIKNDLYIKHCLGTRERPIEIVPIDVLSHDTFEAAILRPMYCGEIYLLEAPCNNYVTWDIRERRWNRGELLLAMYFFPVLVGAPMRWLQRMMQGGEFNRTKVRTQAKLGDVSSYLAHAALRQIALKPLLVSYIIMVDFVQMYYEWLPIMCVMFAIIIFPKFATCNCSNFKAVVLETMASVLQFTPESVVGTIRVLRALKAHLTGNARWVPQRAIEDEFRASNPFIFSLRYLWYYLVFAVGCGILIMSVIPEAIFIMTMLGTLFSLPLYAGFTALTANVVQPMERQATKLGQLTTLAQDSENVLPCLGDGRQTAGLKKASVDLGVRGSVLSPAQKSQVALARAAYDSKAELVLLDHPLALLDEAASNAVIDNLIKGPLMASKTRIVTMPPCPDSLKHFDRVVVLDGGRVVCQGTPDEVLRSNEFQSVQVVPAHAHGKTRVLPPSLAETPTTGVEETLTPPQPGGALWRALQAGGFGRLFAATVTVGLLRIVTQSQLLILGRWADEKQLGALVDDARCIKVTMALIGMSALLQGAQNYFVLAFNQASSKAMFEQAYSGVLRAPLTQFWEVNPAGRVINRLTGDVLTLDLALSTGFAALASFTFSVVVQQVYCLSVMPAWMMAVSIVVLLAFCMMFWGAAIPLQQYSVATMSECQDEFAHIARSATAARAYRFQSRQLSNVVSHSGSIVKANFLGVACAKQWLVMRITFVLCFQCTACVIYGIAYPDAVGIGTLAIIVASTFNILQEIDGVIDTVANGILTKVSLRRVDEYCNLQCEVGTTTKGALSLPADDGIRIQFANVRAGLAGHDDCLRGLTAEISPRSRAAIVGPSSQGRTAALLSIMRVIEPRNGQVLLNGINAKCIGLEKLRSAIAYVPQEPRLFRGTIRFNLCQAGNLPDEFLWNALECTRLATMVRALPGGLDYVLQEDGEGLSFGQKQLLCIATAICRKPAALLMDDSISALHNDDQASVYSAVMAKLPRTTIILASHCLLTERLFDSVLRLDAGKFL